MGYNIRPLAAVCKFRGSAKEAGMPVCPPNSATNPTIPPGFDPDSHPIIAVHFFGLNPANGTAHARDLRRDVQRLHRLGPRVPREFLPEVGAEHTIPSLVGLP